MSILGSFDSLVGVCLGPCCVAFYNSNLWSTKANFINYTLGDSITHVNYTPPLASCEKGRKYILEELNNLSQVTQPARR